MVLPSVTGGTGGWCVTTSPDECPSFMGRFHDPVVAEFWSSSGSSGSPPVTEGFVLTTSAVAAIAVSGGHPIPLRADPWGQEGMRSVTLSITGGPVHSVDGIDLPAGPLPRQVELLDAAGHRIAAAAHTNPGLLWEEPGRGWSRPADPPRGSCRITESTGSTALFEGGFVLSRAIPHSGPFGHPFLSCASASYRLGGWQLVASVLLDGGHPGTRPAALPGMSPLRGHPGVYRALAAEGEMLGRRSGDAWLVVARGEGDNQRLELLEGLSAHVNA
jgi:hypothetical protein